MTDNDSSSAEIEDAENNNAENNAQQELEVAREIPEATAIVRPGSYVRDQLANERTFLAWLRTAVAMMGFGIVMVKLRYLVPNAPPSRGVLHVVQLGLLFAAVGLMMVPFALCHYFATRRAIDGEVYKPEGASIVIFGIAIMIIGVGVIIYLLTSQPPGAGASALIGRNPATNPVLSYVLYKS